MIKIRPDERKAVAHYIHSICAVSLDESKDYLIEGRLSTILDETGCQSFSQLLFRSEADASGRIRRKIIDAITTGETHFFRDSSPFELLRHKIVPELIDRQTRTRSSSPIRIWSAACSTGQELYSIAILLKELLGDPHRYNIRLMGTDISDEAVARASRGVFSNVEMSRGLDDNRRDRYFHRVADGWQIQDELRAVASFRHLNLTKDFSTLGKFDVILCRNVAIYFDDEDRLSLFSRLARSLERDAFLIIGSMESLSGGCPQFKSNRHLRSVYYQLATATPIASVA